MAIWPRYTPIGHLQVQYVCQQWTLKHTVTDTPLVFFLHGTMGRRTHASKMCRHLFARVLMCSAFQPLLLLLLQLTDSVSILTTSTCSIAFTIPTKKHHIIFYLLSCQKMQQVVIMFFPNEVIINKNEKENENYRYKHIFLKKHKKINYMHYKSNWNNKITGKLTLCFPWFSWHFNIMVKRIQNSGQDIYKATQ